MEVTKKMKMEHEKDIEEVALDLLGYASKTANDYKDLAKTPEDFKEKYAEDEVNDHLDFIDPSHVLGLAEDSEQITRDLLPFSTQEDNEITGITIFEDENHVKIENENGEATIYDQKYLAEFLMMIREDYAEDSVTIATKEDFPLVAHNGSYAVALAPRVKTDI